MTLYQPNAPAPTDFLADSQLDIKNNFSFANTSFGVNHVDFSTVTNNGKHKFVEMPNSAALPAGLAAFEGTLYTKTDGSRSQMFYSNDSTGNEYQMTSIKGTTFAQPLFALDTNNYNPGSGAVGTNFTGGWTFLPGGLMLQYGFSLAAPNSVTVLFPVPFTTRIYNIQLTPVNAGQRRFLNMLAGSITLAQFQTSILDSSAVAATTDFYWSAIGL